MDGRPSTEPPRYPGDPGLNPPVYSITDVETLAACLVECEAVMKRELESGIGKPIAMLNCVGVDWLLWAAASDLTSIVRTFIQHGADVNIKDEEGWRPLHHSSHFGHLSTMELLLSADKIDVDAPSNKGWRPIDKAANATVAELLLRHGAKVSASLPGYLSALHHAAFQGKPDVVKLFLERGASVAERCSPTAAFRDYHQLFGGTPLHFAAISLTGFKNLIANVGPKVMDIHYPEVADAPNAQALRVAAATALLDHGADVNGRTDGVTYSEEVQREISSWLLTPLHLAAMAGDAALVTLFCQRGAEVDADTINPRIRTPLLLAAEGGHTECVYALIAAGASVHKLNRMESGCEASALTYAVMCNSHGAIRALLENGAEVSEVVQLMLDAPPDKLQLLPLIIDDKTRALVLRHLTGRSKLQHVCSLPGCEARRTIGYDEKKLKVCPCRTGVYYCCKEHQAQDYKRHRPICRAARDAAAAQ